MSQRQNPGLGALAGAIGGIAGVFAMATLEMVFDHLHGSPAPRPVRELLQRGGRHDAGLTRGRVDGTCLRRCNNSCGGTNFICVSSDADHAPAQALAGVTVHNVFRALFGTAYGFAFEANPEVATGSGLPLGAAVWLLAEELALPVTGLSRGVFVLIQRRNYFYHEYYPARIG